MRGGQHVEHLISAGGEADEHAAAIRGCVLARYQAQLHEAIHQFNSGMMSKLQTFGQFSYGYQLPPRKTFDCQQGLMLLGSESSAFGSVLAESQELAEGMAEGGEVFEFGFGKTFAWAH